MDPGLYAQWFRASTPYIRAHRGKTFVVALGADAQESPNIINIVHDLALLQVLGVRLVIVQGLPPGPEVVGDAEIARALDAAASLRTRLEAMFATGIPASNLRNRHIPLVSGNLVTARPVGVVDGIDRLYAGTVRRVHTDEINALLGAGNLVLIVPIGYSTSGAAYRLNGAALAVEIAAEVQAHKLLVLDALGQVVDGEGSPRSDLSADELARIIDEVDHAPATREHLQALVRSSRRGIPRSHLVSHHVDGALLQELFTALGAGTQVSEGDYRAVRRATSDDVAAIVEMIRPYEADGTLVARPRDRLEEEVGRFWVAELDGMLIGCCALYPHDDGHVELGCLVTNPQYRSNALGQRLLAQAEKVARAEGAHHLFVLTTRAQNWFTDNGFEEVSIDALPASKKAMYNYQRNSKVLIKDIGGTPTPRATSQ